MDFWRFQPQTGFTGLEWTPVLDSELTFLSGLIVLLGAYMLFPVIERLRAADTPAARNLWLALGAISLATACWGMEAITLLELDLPVTLRFNLLISLLAFVPAVVGAGLSLLVLTANAPTLVRIHAASICLAATLLITHLTFMESLVLDATITYSLIGTLASLGVAYVLALVAIYLTVVLQRVGADGFSLRVISGGLFACAALGSHFISMMAATFGAATHGAVDSIFIIAAAPIPAVAFAAALTVSLLILGALLDTRTGANLRGLQHNDVRNNAVIQSMHDAHLCFDERGIVTSFNPAAETIFGFSSSEILGRSVRSLMADTCKQKFGDWLSAEAGVSSSPAVSPRHIQDSGGRRRNGELFPVEYALTCIEGPRGREYSCVLRDLTAPWAMQRHLQIMASAVEFSAVGIAILDGQRKIVHVNPQLATQCRLSAHELLGRRLGEIGQLSSATVAEMWNTIASGRRWSGRTTRRHADGSLSCEDIVLTAVPGNDSNLSSFIAVFHDVTEQVSDAQENARLAAAVRFTADSIQILDPQGRIEYANPAYERDQDTSLDQIRGRRPEELPRVYVQDDNYHQMLDFAGQKGRTWSGILKASHSSGRLLEEQVTVSPILDEAGRVTAFVIVKRDTTEIRRLEAQLQRAFKLEAIGRLAAGIAHEINTPIQFVGDNLQFLRESFSSVSTMLARVSGTMIDSDDTRFILDEVPKAIDQSLDGCTRVARIVRAMKEFSHPGTDLKMVDLNRAIQSTITVATNEWKYLADIRLDLDPELPHVRCQLGEINQAVLNMVVNAAQAIGEKPGTGASTKGIIEVATRRHTDAVEISIADNGVGIPPEAQERIFDPFFTTKDIGKGTGQGLAIAHDAIVHKHHGTIDVESTVGKGTTFVIRLPLSLHNETRSAAA